ncbi:MAG TPA: hypothetical protein VMT35_16510 [Ignavibacteriaceae bacterium]|nr:hypothetical protein [Ignavibacteriaceae bacterium]
MLKFMHTGKILFIFLLSSFLITAYSQANPIVSPKICLDIAGKHAVSMGSANGSLNVNTGISIGFEILSNTGSNFNFGGGLMYLIPREQQVSGSGKFNFIPIYGLIKIDLSTNVPVTPSLIGSVGYNVLFNGDSNYKGPTSLKGGLYLAGGIRISPGTLFFEVLYKSFSGSANYQNLNFDIVYTTLSIGMGLEI